MPFSPLHLVLLIILLAVLIAIVQVGVLSIALERLGLSPEAGMTVLFASLFGSMINLPLFRMKTSAPDLPVTQRWPGLLRPPLPPFSGETLVAVNVGGCLIPFSLCLYLLTHIDLDLATVVVAVSGVSAVCYFASRPVPGIGIGMPIFVAPITAALLGVLLDGGNSAPLAYIGGTLGVIIGADILRLGAIRTMGAPLASIGGAGTFDGIFITGIVAVLLA